MAIFFCPVFCCILYKKKKKKRANKIWAPKTTILHIYNTVNTMNWYLIIMVRNAHPYDRLGESWPELARLVQEPLQEHHLRRGAIRKDTHKAKTHKDTTITTTSNYEYHTSDNKKQQTNLQHAPKRTSQSQPTVVETNRRAKPIHKTTNQSPSSFNKNKIQTNQSPIFLQQQNNPYQPITIFLQQKHNP